MWAHLPVFNINFNWIGVIDFIVIDKSLLANDLHTWRRYKNLVYCGHV